MLVLTRKMHEKIQIGSNITITILRVKGGAVRVGVEAPTSISILRDEVAQRDAAAGRQAVNVSVAAGHGAAAKLPADARRDGQAEELSDEPCQPGATRQSTRQQSAALNDFVQRRRVPSVETAALTPHQEHSGAASPHFEAPGAGDLSGLLLL